MEEGRREMSSGTIHPPAHHSTKSPAQQRTSRAPSPPARLAPCSQRSPRLCIAHQSDHSPAIELNHPLTQPRPTNLQCTIRLASRDLLRRRNRNVRVSGLLVRVYADVDDALDARILLEVGFQDLLVVYAGVLDN